MAPDRPAYPVSLKVVAPAETRRAARSGERDWSQLMSHAQDGDRDAYRALLEGVTPYLRAMAGRCFRQASDIEDAVQDVLLTLHAVRQTYDPARPFGPWLAAIANRRMIDRLRRETRIRARELVLSEEHEAFADPGTGPQDRAEAIRLGEALARLSPEQQQAVKLLKLDELSLNEAASLSGRSAGALKVAAHRAVARLRQILNVKDSSRG